MDAWSNKLVLETLGLTGLVDAGLYDTSGKHFMWGARFSNLLENFARVHPTDALKLKVPFESPCAKAPHAADALLGATRRSLGSGCSFQIWPRMRVLKILRRSGEFYSCMYTTVWGCHIYCTTTANPHPRCAGLHEVALLLFSLTHVNHTFSGKLRSRTSAS